MSVSETIILGIIAGVLTTIFIALSLAVLNSLLIPWYRKIVYPGIDISGEWNTSLQTKDVNETAIMVIEQRADKISCIMTISIHHSETDIEMKTYKMSGQFEDSFLSLRGKNINNKHIGIDVALLQVINGGNKMIGYEAWFSTIHDEIDSEKMEWKRA